MFASHTKNDIAVLQVGTSDVENSSVEQLCENYNKLIDSVAETAPESKILVTAVPQRMPLDSRSSALNKKTDQLNVHLRDKCSLTNQAIFIDASPPLQKLNYRADGYHFSYKGLSFFARYVSNYSCVFGKRKYRVLVRVSVCVCLCVCVCFCTITQKEIDLGTRNWNTL